MEPLSIVWHAANRAIVPLKDTKVLIIGTGPVRMACFVDDFDAYTSAPRQIGLLLLKVVQ